MFNLFIVTFKFRRLWSAVATFFFSELFELWWRELLRNKNHANRHFNLKDFSEIFFLKKKNRFEFIQDLDVYFAFLSTWLEFSILSFKNADDFNKTVFSPAVAICSEHWSNDPGRAFDLVFYFFLNIKQRKWQWIEFSKYTGRLIAIVAVIYRVKLNQK